MKRLIFFITFISIIQLVLLCSVGSFENQQGQPDSTDTIDLYNLGVRYNLGIGVQKNIVKAENFFLNAAKKGHINSQYELGILLMDKRDIDSAVYWLDKAANNKDAKAQYLLGLMYEKGEKLDQNYEKSLAYYNLGVQQGDPFSQYRLGLMYEFGRGVKKNFEKALLLYKRAADQDYVKAQFSLGLLYMDGKGTEKNWVCAYKWFSIAAKRWKHAGAKNNAQKIKKEMSATQLKETIKLVDEWHKNMEGKNPLGSPFVEM